MKIRTRLVLLTASLQIASLFLLSAGVMAVLKAYEDTQQARSEDLLRHAIARTALDALIQRDQVQLLSYLNFLKGQHPALSYARVAWRKSDKVINHEMGDTAAGPAVRERKVLVSDPSQPGQTVEVVFGVDQDALRAPIVESRRRTLKVLVGVAVLTAFIGLFVAFLFARAMTEPLNALGRLAAEIGRGRLGERLDWKSDDEIGLLVGAFNAMSERLAELDTVKKNFISSVTHELRSPLGAIESFLGLIHDKMTAGPEGERQSREYLERIAVNVRRLSGFINDLLDVAKIEKGKMECVLRPTELGALVQDVCQFFEAKAGSQGVALSGGAAGVPPVLADADRVRQVLVNLVSNALKFTPAGGRVAISAEQVREGEQRWVEVVVADTGRGMDDADRRRLFQPFTQGRNTAEGVTGHKGTGLGLFIVRSIIDQHGGRLDVQSMPGQGTRVRFSLKAA